MDEPLRPLNMVEEGNAEDLESGTGQTQAPEQGPAEPTDDAAAKRVRALVASSAARLARRIHRTGTIGENEVAEVRLAYHFLFHQFPGLFARQFARANLTRTAGNTRVIAAAGWFLAMRVRRFFLPFRGVGSQFSVSSSSERLTPRDSAAGP